MKIIRFIGKLILLAYLSLLFNGEIYASHGFAALISIPLLFFYVIYISTMYLLIKKFHFTPQKIFITGSTIGIMLEAFYTKSIFVAPFFLGINWLSVLIQIVYWGMAATLPFYVHHLAGSKDSKEGQGIGRIIIVYITAEFLLGAIFHYPTTIWIWIVTGTVLGIFVIRALQKKVLIFSEV